MPVAEDWPELLYTVRKLTFRGDDSTRADIAAELRASSAHVTAQLLRLCEARLVSVVPRPGGSLDWVLTEAGERALSAQLTRRRGPRPGVPRGATGQARRGRR